MTKVTNATATSPVTVSRCRPSAQLTGRGGTCVGQHRRLPAAQVCVKPDLFIDWILQAVIKRNTSQDQRLNEYLGVSSIYTFIHKYIYLYIYIYTVYTLFISDVSGQLSHRVSTVLHPVSCKKNAGVPWWAVTSAGNSDRSRGRAAPLAVFAWWWQATQSPNIVYQCTCGSVWHVIFLLENMDLYTFEKKTRTVMSWENMNYMIIFKLCWCFMFLILPDGCPALTEEGTKEAAKGSIDDLRMSMALAHWLGQVKQTLEESVWDNGQAPFGDVCQCMLWISLCYFVLLWSFVF